jgi:hypothetical protein
MKKRIFLFLCFYAITNTHGQTSEEFYILGTSKDSLKDYSGAITNYTIAIKMNPNVLFYYFARGKSKGRLRDHTGAIED